MKHVVVCFLVTSIARFLFKLQFELDRMVNPQAFPEDITAELTERIVILTVVLDDEVIPGPIRPVAFATGHSEICFHAIFSQNIMERCSEWSAGLGLSSLALNPDLFPNRQQRGLLDSERRLS